MNCVAAPADREHQKKNLLIQMENKSAVSLIISRMRIKANANALPTHNYLAHFQMWENITGE